MYITYHGIENTDVNAEIISIDVPSRAEQSQDEIYIPGRQSPMLKSKEEHKSYSIALTVRAMYQDDMSTIYQWLSGSGQLILSDTPDRYYNVSACSVVSTRRIGAANTIREAKIKLTCLPFAYAIANDPITFASSPADFHTIGTIYSEPIIKIYGSGDITICVNGNYFTIKGVDEYCVIDVPRRVLHKDGVSILSQSIGALTKLLLVPDPLAHNHITWTPTCTAVEIIKNERWL